LRLQPTTLSAHPSTLAQLLSTLPRFCHQTI
jgi:hypothetical protein